MLRKQKPSIDSRTHFRRGNEKETQKSALQCSQKFNAHHFYKENCKSVKNCGQ